MNLRSIRQTGLFRAAGIASATALALALCGGPAGAALAQTAANADREKLLAAYELAHKCFVADGFARQNRQEAGDQARAQYYDGKAKQAFDAAVRLSKSLGYTSARFDIDFKAISNRELARLMEDDGYFDQIAAQCKAYGLM